MYDTKGNSEKIKILRAPRIREGIVSLQLSFRVSHDGLSEIKEPKSLREPIDPSTCKRIKLYLIWFQFYFLAKRDRAGLITASFFS